MHRRCFLKSLAALFAVPLVPFVMPTNVAGVAGKELEQSDIEPKPPGPICPLCGSEDIDLFEGNRYCYNCGIMFSYRCDIAVHQ